MEIIKTTKRRTAIAFEDVEEIDRLFYDLMEARSDLYYKRCGNIKQIACINALVCLLANASLNERNTHDKAG